MTAQLLFSDESQQYLLLQLDDALLNQPLVIKAASGSSSVLCSPTQTYTLKDVQQSNSLLFAGVATATDDASLAIQGEATSWLESTRVKPSIQFNLDIHDPDDDKIGRGLAADELYARTPASDAEIEEALSQQMAVHLEVCGGLVELHEDYVLRSLRTLLNIVQETGMQLTSVNQNDFARAVASEGEDGPVLNFLLKRFSSGPDTSRCIDGDEVCRYTGQVALKQIAHQPCSLSTFKEAWLQRTPVQYQSQAEALTLLDGLYVQPASSLIQYFSVASLSRDPKGRLTQLFDVKERWREAEISAFLSDLVDGDTKAVNSLIMKLARKVKIGKEVFVEARK